MKPAVRFTILIALLAPTVAKAAQRLDPIASCRRALTP